MLYRLCHPRYILANTSQVKGSFFTPDTPWADVQHLERLLSPYESFAWPLQGLFPFVNAQNVIASITGWRRRSDLMSGTTTSSTTSTEGSRFLVIAGEHDVLCTPVVLEDAANRYRKAFQQVLERGKLDEARNAARDDGVRFMVIPGVAHHIQNHAEWQRGADEILNWLQQF